ncbi:MAG: hypothetical protein ABR976_01150 [Terracidiphilus sp.]|jgi:uncharacterized protein with PIN domain
MAIEANQEITKRKPAMELVDASSVAADRDHPVLKEIVVEASRALARLDANRLEELARSCQALNRDLPHETPEIRADVARQAHEAMAELAVFGRVLEATRANLNVMQRLRDLRAGRLEYGAVPSQGWARMEGGHGDD